MNFIALVFITVFSLAAEPPQSLLRVVLDITRGIQRGCVYQEGQEIRCFPLSGGRNLEQTYNSPLGKVRYCSFTTTGMNLIPVQAQRSRYSEAFSHGLEYFVSFDEARGVGTHVGDISTYSGSCIRLRQSDAKFLYDLVRNHSQMYGERVLSTKVRYDVIDNTPGRQEAECKCSTNYLRYESPQKLRAERICNGTLTAQEIFDEGQASLAPPIDALTDENVRPRARPATLTGTVFAPRAVPALARPN